MQSEVQGSASAGEIRKRVHFLLTNLWSGNQREMARALSVTQGLLSKVLSGKQGPGPRLLRALAGHPEVNEGWLRTGMGQPIPIPTEGSLPVAVGPLPGPPLRYPHLATGIRHPVAKTHERPTRYWLALSSTSALLREPMFALAPGDLLLFEGDPAWTHRPDMTDGRLCAVQFADEYESTLEIGLVASTPHQVVVRLFGGSFVLPAPPKTRSGAPSKVSSTPIRRRIRPLEVEEKKARMREKSIAEAKLAAADGLVIKQTDIVAIQIYMARPQMVFTSRLT